MHQKTRIYRTLAAIAAFYILLFVLERVVPSYSMLFPVLKKTAVYGLVAVSMNLLNGFTGLFSLGQAGFMLLGAYTYAIFMIPEASRESVYRMFGGEHWITFSLSDVFGSQGAGAAVGMVIALALGGLVAALFAYLIGLPVLRLKSDYLAIATLGFAEIIRAFFQWDKLGPLTNGANVLNGFPYFSSVLPFYLVAGGCIAVIVLLINSTYGRAFKAIRDDEVAAEAMGVNLARHKMASFVISSFFAGVGGGLLAMYQCMAQANNFKTNMTYEILLIVVIGGIGSISGSVLASFLFTACNEWWLRFLDDESLGIPLFRGGFRKVVFALIIMVIVLFFRRGIMGDKELPDVLRGMRGKRRPRKGGSAQ
ncbi:branched-chain amino acid ABC transporter permease [Oscillibacter sp. MSJ-2]|uniref:Branched-chain amino acid ABC transporter permease n=1 Tax=Dysosmobacter acutus TaxID=2841504 RepID=A0ABS6F539_9FIRM|nr:branched-chain amino acid ABC transporter permease [Dysosmobacter acutus]MBU5625413.1 branched-chain amino acid ABC transporter permease [Dysosmobacter acutus]